MATEVVLNSGDGITVLITYNDSTFALTGIEAVNNTNRVCVLVVTRPDTQATASRTIQPNSTLARVNINAININVNTTPYVISARWG